MSLEKGVCYDQCVLLAKLLAFALLHSVPQGWICLLLQVFLDFSVLNSKSLLLYLRMYMCVHAKSLQSCLTLCNPMDCSLPGSSVHGILQARILEWVAMPSSRGSSWPRDWTHISLCFLHWQAGSFNSTWKHNIVNCLLGLSRTATLNWGRVFAMKYRD